MSTWWGDSENMEEIEFSRWLFEGRPRQGKNVLPDGLNWLCYFVGSSKSHRENWISCIFLESPHQVDMKNVVKCWKDFLWYFATLKTYCGPRLYFTNTNLINDTFELYLNISRDIHWSGNSSDLCAKFLRSGDGHMFFLLCRFNGGVGFQFFWNNRIAVDYMQKIWISRSILCRHISKCQGCA